MIGRPTDEIRLQKIVNDYRTGLTANDAAIILNMSSGRAGRMLSIMCREGKLTRTTRHGTKHTRVYMPLEASV